MSSGFRWSSAWLGAGVAFTTATQLRASAAPIGPGELLLVVWLLAAAAWRMYEGRVWITPLTRVAVSFWVLGYTLLLCGWFAAFARGEPSPLALHDAFAFVFVAVWISVLTIRPGVYEELRGGVRWVILASVGPLSALLLLGLAGLPTGPIRPWDPPRFQGWATNANQAALAVAAVPFVAFHLAGRRRGRARAGYVLVGLASLAIGVATLSDALFVAWAGSGALAVCLAWFKLVRRRSLPYWRAVGAYILVPLVLAASMAFVGYPLWVASSELASEVYHAGGQGSVRVTLWTNAVAAIARSPLVGLGPGPHSRGQDGSISEAHNVFLDWGASTGVLGLAAYVLLLLWVVVQTRGTRSAMLLPTVVSLTLMGVFHYVLRHPTFWFYLAYVAAEGRALKAAGPSEPGPRDGGPGARLAGLPA